MGSLPKWNPLVLLILVLLLVLLLLKKRKKKKSIIGLGPREGNKRDLEISKNTHKKTTERERVPEKKNKGLVQVVVTSV